MAKQKKTQAVAEPKIIRGSHSTRIEYPDGRVDFETHWDELVRDVNQALEEYAQSQVTSEVKTKVTRAKKEKKNV